VEHDGAVFRLELLDQRERRFGSNDFFNHVGLQIKRSS
jgi:hypothetical protein